MNIELFPHFLENLALIMQEQQPAYSSPHMVYYIILHLQKNSRFVAYTNGLSGGPGEYCMNLMDLGLPCVMESKKVLVCIWLLQAGLDQQFVLSSLLTITM